MDMAAASFGFFRNWPLPFAIARKRRTGSYMDLEVSPEHGF